MTVTTEGKYGLSTNFWLTVKICFTMVILLMYVILLEVNGFTIGHVWQTCCIVICYLYSKSSPGIKNTNNAY